jgi:PKHD-type hydroxylase
MTQHLPIWYMGNVDPAICDKAIAEFEKIPSKDATMGSDGQITEQSRRNTTVRFAEPGNWFGDIMFKHALEANAVCKWDYAVNGHENVQYGEYGEGQHYGWHTDTFTLSGRPDDRKISVVCMLSDPHEFEGGEFLMRLYNEYQPELKKGTLMAFPSILEHQVLPVTKGLRKSAVIWAYGPRFR